MAAACGTDFNRIKHGDWKDGCTDRINRLRNKYFNNMPEIDTERARAYTEIYKENEGDEVIIKRAKALYHYLENKTLFIDEDELIIGTDGKKQRSVVMNPDMCYSWYRDELETMSTRPQDPYFITEEDKKYIREEIVPFWTGKSMEDWFQANLEDDLVNVGIGTNVVFGDLKSQGGAGEYAVGYGNILIKKGFGAIRQEAVERMEALDPFAPESFEKKKYYEATIICCDAVKMMSERYAGYARRLAKNANEKRKAELLRIADICEKVPYNPPETFQEGLQFVWFTQMFLWAEENSNSYCIDRPDQYLYPLYKKDIEEGRITEEEALELIECFWIKIAEFIFTISKDGAEFYAGYMSFTGLTLGGCDQDGKDAVNELSYLMIQATMDLRMHSPTINVRVCDETPDEYLEKICDLVKLGTGQPAIFFDKTAIKLFERRGLPESLARNWCVGGCVEPNIPGITNMWGEGCRYSYATAVEWALFNGYCKTLDRQMGLKTGDPRDFKSFDEFYDAVKAQLAYLIKLCVRFTQLSEKAHMRRAPKPVRSMTMEGCIENGVDCSAGGAKYNNGPGLEPTGVADIADSLEAVKKLVYDDKKISMDQLIQALENNFEGYEDIRQMLINEAPKYGNDIDEVDRFAAETVEFSCDEAVKYRSMHGSTFLSGLVPVSSNLPHGKAIWALPSGRKATESLSDGLSPFPGYDKEGPTSVIKSVCKVDHTKNGVGTLLNMKLNPHLLETKKDKQNFISLLRAENALGGYHIQFNVISSDTLRKAKACPQDYADLLVRVAGYSAFFVELAPEAQDAIINRTENTAW